MPIYEWDENIQALVPQLDSSKRLSKWACFDCRKAFGRKRKREPTAVVLCPDCGANSTDMGYLFQPPPKKARRAWENMEVIAEFGLRFNRTGSAFFIDQYLTDGCSTNPKALRATLEEMVAQAKPGSEIGRPKRRSARIE